MSGRGGGRGRGGGTGGRGSGGGRAGGAGWGQPLTPAGPAGGNALDVVLRETPSNNYEVIERSFFHPSLGQQGTLGNGVEYWRGYNQSIRPTQMGLSLNIDISATGFYEPVGVTEF